MPSEQWFKDNPKVSAYISPELNQKLLEWMKQRGMRKVSQAITAILEEHLGVAQSSPSVQTVDDSRVTALEGKLIASFRQSQN